MKIRKLFVCMCVFGLILGLTACGAKGDKKSSFDTTANSPTFTAEATEEEGMTDNTDGLPSKETGSTANAELVNTSQKLIKNVNLSLETLEYDNLLTFLDQKIKEFNGYVEDSQSYGNSLANNRLRNANLTIRVPNDRLYEFVHLIGENTTIIEKSESTQDVTSEYVDTESRKKALEIQLERLFVLLEKADMMEDILTLESRISEVTYQLESYTSTIRTYDNLVNYSTVSILISEVERVSTPKEKPEGTLEKMKNGVSDSLYNIKEGFMSFSVWFVTNLPYLIIWAVIIIIAVLVTKKVYKVYNAKYSYNGNNVTNGNSQNHSNSYLNGTNQNRSNSDVTNSDVTNSNGTNSNGTNSNGTNSNGE